VVVSKTSEKEGKARMPQKKSVVTAREGKKKVKSAMSGD